VMDCLILCLVHRISVSCKNNFIVFGESAVQKIKEESIL
jgi:hypothetical protein